MFTFGPESEEPMVKQLIRDTAGALPAACKPRIARLEASVVIQDAKDISSHLDQSIDEIMSVADSGFLAQTISRLCGECPHHNNRSGVCLAWVLIRRAMEAVVIEKKRSQN